jgi:DNA polymerase-3 subunit delta
MIIFFYGEETYRPTQKTHELKERYLRKNPSGSGLIIFDCDEKCDITDIIRSLGAQNLFAQNQLIVIKNIFQNTKAPEQAKLIESMAQSTPDVIVFVENGTVRKNAPLYKWLIDHAQPVFESKMLTGKDLEKWIMKHAVERGGAIEFEAVRELILFIDNDLWRLSSEIDKLVAYARDRAITASDVHKIVHGHVNADIFQTIETLMAGDKQNALAQLRRQILSGDDDFRIFGMLAYHIRTLLVVASAANEYGTASRDTIAKATGVHPFVVQKTLVAVRRFSIQKIKKIHADLTSFDREIKTGERDIGSALDLFIMNT